jgi:uncharacterized protein (TIGR03086 family)
MTRSGRSRIRPRRCRLRSTGRELSNALTSDPLGTATGAERLQIRLYDLLAHGWDLAQATGQPAALPEDLAEQALAFAHTYLADQARPGRFAPAQLAADHAPAIERFAAFLGRAVPAQHSSRSAPH